MSDVFLIHDQSVARFDMTLDTVMGDPVAVSAQWALPSSFGGTIDVGLNYGDGKAYLFRGSEYVRIDIATQAVETEARSIGQFWSGTLEQGFDADLDAGVNYGDGTIYLFKGDGFASYSIAEDRLTGVGSIKDWKLAADGSFDSALDAVVNYGNGDLYVFKGDKYVRYSMADGSVTEVRSIGQFWAGTTAAGVAADLDGSWCTADPAGRAAPVSEPVVTDTSTPTDTTTATMSAYRTEVIRLLDHFKGHIEKDPVFEKEFLSHAVMEEQRKIAGTKGITYTTCVDFQMRIFSVAAANLSLTPKLKVLGLLAEANGGGIGAWVTASPGTTERPQPGDIFMLHKAESPTQFSHTGYLRSITANDDGTETWTTVDGGQGTAGKYDAAGTLLQAGAEALLEVSRIYHPDTNLITGEANQGGAARLVRGWVNIDALV